MTAARPQNPRALAELLQLAASALAESAEGRHPFALELAGSLTRLYRTAPVYPPGSNESNALTVIAAVVAAEVTAAAGNPVRPAPAVIR